MIRSGGLWLLLLVPLRMIQSGASGVMSPVNARVVLRPFLLVSPLMIQSWELLGLVSASLHYHGLVRVLASLHHHGLLLLAAALLLYGLVLLAAAPLHLVLGLLFTSLHCHGLILPMVALPLRGLVLISASSLYPGLILTAASLHHSGLIHRSVSLLHHGLVLIFADPRLLRIVHFSASLHFLGLVICVASGLVSFAAPPWSRPPVSFASGRHFPWTLQPGGWGPLLVDPPRAFMPGAATIFPRPRWLWPLLLVLPQTLQSVASAHHVSLHFCVVGAVAPAACSTPDVPVWGVWPPFVPG